MQLVSSRVRIFFAFGIALAMSLGNAGLAVADSNIIDPSSAYQAADHLTSLDPTGYDVHGDLVAVYASQHLRLYNRNSWQLISDLGDAGYTTSATYNSFVKFDPSGESVWVGYTVGGNVNDRIYQVTGLDSAPAWNHVATLASNYELAFSGGAAYVSGPNSTIFGADNAIWQLDTSGNNNHTLIASVGGFAAGIAFDATGNLYYGTNLGTDDRLVTFSAAQVAEGGKSLFDAATLSDIPHPASDVEVDSAGHVLFTTNNVDLYWNQLGSTLGMWNGTSGSGANYEVIGEAGVNHWYNAVRAIGDVTAGGTAYLDDGGAWGSPIMGLAEINPTPAPEPSTLVLVLCGLAALAWQRRRSRRS